MSRSNHGEPEESRGSRWTWDKISSRFLLVWAVITFITVFLSISDQIEGGPKPGDVIGLSLLVAVVGLIPLVQGIGLLVYPAYFARGADPAVLHWPRRIGFVLACAGLFGILYEVARSLNPSLVRFMSPGTFSAVFWGFVGVFWLLRQLARRDIQNWRTE